MRRTDQMLDHGTLPSIRDAALPRSYEAAKAALAKCSNIDECKGWADKAKALASYAKQQKDESLFKYAQQIRARATRQVGKLLEKVKPAKNRHFTRTPEGTSRKQAATAAGLSKKQKDTALRVAKVPESEFERLVDNADTTATVKELAGRGTVRVISDDDARAAKAWAQFRSRVRSMIEILDAETATTCAGGRAAPDRNDVLALCDRIETKLSEIVRCIRQRN